MYRPLGEELTAFPGQLLRFRIVLKPAAGGPNQPWHLELRMPDRFRFGLIEIAGGPAEEFCGRRSARPGHVEALLDKLENKRRHDVLSARLLVGDALTSGDRHPPSRSVRPGPAHGLRFAAGEGWGRPTRFSRNAEQLGTPRRKRPEPQPSQRFVIGTRRSRPKALGGA